MNKLDEIFHWNMTETEAKAYKIALLWDTITQKMLKKSLAGKLPKHGDPRKSLVFKHCWKMYRETRQFLEPVDWKYFIVAQIYICSLYKGNVSPSILGGDKAWARWMVYKNKYAKAQENLRMEYKQDDDAVSLKISQELFKTKKFLFEKCGGIPTFSQISSFFDQKVFGRWIESGKISSFYLVLSPWISKIGFEKFNRELFESKLTSLAKDIFKQEFMYEFS
jgi:hypothetical protein